MGNFGLYFTFLSQGWMKVCVSMVGSGIWVVGLWWAETMIRTMDIHVWDDFKVSITHAEK